MTLIKFGMAKETGEEVGVLFVNTDQIIAISMGQNSTELQMSDEHTFWAKDKIGQVVAVAKAG
jgi:hypothetical protein